ncbi:hypothetical protein N7537_010001 [Penicillium hordei]|uniref:RING-type domain-containing protein n=1 Tax=Penicillium hordei TaxID=40994 RepID=A0AAD6DVC4_9EURO|nr:uncharacterized protein N7537_010001 [Penicillium hordei]KAJ5593097.1 hypothetical protein N7537_010001 [Penicillium hordei]
MARYSNTIIIPDDEESSSLEPTISRPRRYPRRDYRYQEFESMLVEAIDDAPIMPPSHQDNVFKNFRNAVDDEIQLLRDKNRALLEELRQEREERQKLEEQIRRGREERQKMEEQLSLERDRLVLECKICYMQPDLWMTLLCGHLFCNSCAGNLDTSKECPICRTSITGYVRCRPFSG